MGLKTLMELLNNRYEKWYTKTALNQKLKMDNAIIKIINDFQNMRGNMIGIWESDISFQNLSSGPNS